VAQKEGWWPKGRVGGSNGRAPDHGCKGPGFNPSTSQGWDYWQSPVTLLLGSQSKGLLGAPASITSERGLHKW
jgi:hypothetical protein